jgi:zinc-binding alcohol dehydrogenase family protein
MASTQTIKAYGITQYGPPEEVLHVVEVPKPQPGPRDLLVRVVAVATNPVDVKQITNYSGNAALSEPLIPGWDASGVVEAVGSQVTLFKPGDEVYFAGVINRPGSFAEYTAVDERVVALKPSSLSHEDAAALPLTALTAWEVLAEGFHIPIPADVGDDTVNQNKTLLVLGGAGGVGSIALQIAKHVLKIGRIIGSASRPETVAWCKSHGADETINHHNPLDHELGKLGLKGVDYIFNTSEPDPVIDQLIQLVNPLGRIGHILAIKKPLITAPLFRKRASLVWEMMFARGLFNAEPEKQGAILKRVAELVDAKVLHTTANIRFAWDKLPQALALQDSGKATGKIVLTVAF